MSATRTIIDTAADKGGKVRAAIVEQLGIWAITQPVSASWEGIDSPIEGTINEVPRLTHLPSGLLVAYAAKATVLRHLMWALNRVDETQPIGQRMRAYADETRAAATWVRHHTDPCAQYSYRWVGPLKRGFKREPAQR